MKIELYKDRKVTMWERDVYLIEAESEEEAKNKLLNLIDEDLQYEESEGFVNTETLYETIEDMSPEDNGGEYTEEIISAETLKTIWRNV